MANGYGLYDMAGNVWELCWDWHSGTYYGDVTANTNPRGPTTGAARLLRGGAWSAPTSNLRCAFRSYTGAFDGLSLSTSNDTIGFRCARGF